MSLDMLGLDSYTEQELKLSRGAFGEGWARACQLFIIDCSVSLESCQHVLGEARRHNPYSKALEIREQERINALQDRAEVYDG